MMTVTNMTETGTVTCDLCSGSGEIEHGYDPETGGALYALTCHVCKGYCTLVAEPEEEDRYVSENDYYMGEEAIYGD
jgi:DnaJ-class molecular chaperone